MMRQGPVEFLERQPEDRSSWYPTRNYMSGKKACHEQGEVKKQKIKMKLENYNNKKKKKET